MAPAGSGMLALLDTLTFPELLAIIVIALVVLGPEKLPGAARTAGEWIQRIRSLTATLESEVREVLDDPAMQPIRELGEFAAQPRRKLAEYARAAGEESSAARRSTTPSEVVPPGTEPPAAVAPTAEPPPAEPDAAAPTVAAGDATPAEEPPAGVFEAEPVTKVVATGPDHPMERLSPVADPTAEGEPGADGDQEPAGQ